VDEGHPLLEALDDPDFRWFLQWAWPWDGALRIMHLTMQEQRKAIQLLDAKQGTILHLTQEPSGNWFGYQRGPFPLWQRVQRFYRRYQEMQRPGKQAYQVRMNEKQALLSVSGMELHDLFAHDSAE